MGTIKMLINFYDKRAQDKVLSLYWIMILIITAGGIFGMVYSFYNHPYDVRQVEAEILTHKVADCLSYGGDINSNVFLDNGFDGNFGINFLDECNLNLKTLGEEEITEFYVDINFYDSEKLGESVFNFDLGNKGLIAGCNIQSEKEFEKEVRCIEKEFFSFEGDNLYLIKIFSIVRKTPQNVK